MVKVAVLLEKLYQYNSDLCIDEHVVQVNVYLHILQLN
jgi:hypothetical protein